MRDKKIKLSSYKAIYQAASLALKKKKKKSIFLTDLLALPECYKVLSAADVTLKELKLYEEANNQPGFSAEDAKAAAQFIQGHFLGKNKASFAYVAVIVKDQTGTQRVIIVPGTPNKGDALPIEYVIDYLPVEIKPEDVASASYMSIYPVPDNALTELKKMEFDNKLVFEKIKQGFINIINEKDIVVNSGDVFPLTEEECKLFLTNPSD